MTTTEKKPSKPKSKKPKLTNKKTTDDVTTTTTTTPHSNGTTNSSSKPKSKPNGKPKLTNTKIDDVTTTTTTAAHSNGTTNSSSKPNSKPNGKPKLTNTKTDDVTTTTTTAAHSNGTTNSSSKPKPDDVITTDNNKSVTTANGSSDSSGILYNIPMQRVSRIIKSEDPSIRITQEALFVVNKASEKFLQLFTTEAYASAFLDRKKQIDYKHLSSVVGKRKRFDFLADFVPEKVKAEDALKEMPTGQ